MEKDKQKNLRDVVFCGTQFIQDPSESQIQKPKKKSLFAQNMSKNKQGTQTLGFPSIQKLESQIQEEQQITIQTNILQNENQQFQDLPNLFNDPAIHAENINKIQQMSLSEIKQEQNELKQLFSEEELNILKALGKNKLQIKKNNQNAKIISTSQQKFDKPNSGMHPIKQLKQDSLNEKNNFGKQILEQHKSEQNQLKKLKQFKASLDGSIIYDQNCELEEESYNDKTEINFIQELSVEDFVNIHEKFFTFFEICEMLQSSSHYHTTFALKVIAEVLRVNSHQDEFLFTQILNPKKTELLEILFVCSETCARLEYASPLIQIWLVIFEFYFNKKDNLISFDNFITMKNIINEQNLEKPKMTQIWLKDWFLQEENLDHQDLFQAIINDKTIQRISGVFLKYSKVKFNENIITDKQFFELINILLFISPEFNHHLIQKCNILKIGNKDIDCSLFDKKEYLQMVTISIQTGIQVNENLIDFVFLILQYFQKKYKTDEFDFFDNCFFQFLMLISQFVRYLPETLSLKENAQKIKNFGSELKSKYLKIEQIFDYFQEKSLNNLYQLILFLQSFANKENFQQESQFYAGTKEYLSKFEPKKEDLQNWLLANIMISKKINIQQVSLNEILNFEQNILTCNQLLYAMHISQNSKSQISFAQIELLIKNAELFLKNKDNSQKQMIISLTWLDPILQVIFKYLQQKDSQINNQQYEECISLAMKLLSYGDDEIWEWIKKYCIFDISIFDDSQTLKVLSSFEFCKSEQNNHKILQSQMIDYKDIFEKSGDGKHMLPLQKDWLIRPLFYINQKQEQLQILSQCIFKYIQQLYEHRPSLAKKIILNGYQTIQLIAFLENNYQTEEDPYLSQKSQHVMQQLLETTLQNEDIFDHHKFLEQGIYTKIFQENQYFQCVSEYLKQNPPNISHVMNLILIFILQMPKMKFYISDKQDNEIIQFLGEVGYETLSCIIRSEIEEKEFANSLKQFNQRQPSKDIQRVSKSILDKILYFFYGQNIDLSKSFVFQSIKNLC